MHRGPNSIRKVAEEAGAIPSQKTSSKTNPWPDLGPGQRQASSMSDMAITHAMKPASALGRIPHDPNLIPLSGLPWLRWALAEFPSVTSLASARPSCIAGAGQ